MTIKIKNCNNITSGEVTVLANKLNILFGRNGTGKSTIARAIHLFSQNKPLAELAPYGSTSTDLLPSIEGVSSGSIVIFDDEYVSQYVYQPDSLIKDAFEVLIRSPEYDTVKEKIDNALNSVKTRIKHKAPPKWQYSGCEQQRGMKRCSWRIG